jgi:hypothetical protein
MSVTNLTFDSVKKWVGCLGARLCTSGASYRVEINGDFWSFVNLDEVVEFIEKRIDTPKLL